MIHRACMAAFFAAVFLAGFGAVPVARAADYGDLRIVTVTRDFKDVAQDVADAIVNRGLVIDHRGYIGKMLKRTGQAAGGGKAIYTQAQYFQFCSALFSRRMMEADPRNIGYCPFVIVVYELAAKKGTVHVGFRRPPQAGSDASRKALAAVDTLLRGIVKDATE